MTPPEVVVPVEPGFDEEENEITIPSVTGVIYKIDGNVVTGVVPITENTTVTAEPDEGYAFPPEADDEWTFTFTG